MAFQDAVFYQVFCMVGEEQKFLHGVVGDPLMLRSEIVGSEYQSWLFSTVDAPSNLRYLFNAVFHFLGRENLSTPVITTREAVGANKSLLQWTIEELSNGTQIRIKHGNQYLRPNTNGTGVELSFSDYVWEAVFANTIP